MAPPSVAEYVIGNELAHLHKPNPAEAFRSIVEIYDPDYQTQAGWPEQPSARFDLFEKYYLNFS